MDPTGAKPVLCDRLEDPFRRARGLRFGAKRSADETLSHRELHVLLIGVGELSGGTVDAGEEDGNDEE